MTSDSWRNFQLLKHSCKQEHPFSKFGCGNYETLTNGGNIEGKDAVSSGGSSPRDDLIEFWKKHYVAENMKLCVVGKASLDELQKSVEETFAEVRSKTTDEETDKNTNFDGKNDNLFSKEHSKYGIPGFGSSETGVVREVIPLAEVRSIRFHFATPPMDDEALTETRPFRVLSHLLGHESPGSLNELLLEEGLVNGLSSGGEFI